MKKIHKALFLFILLLNFNPHLEALSPLDNAITVNKESKILTAPEAVRYQWFFNHKKLNLETPDIRFLYSTCCIQRSSFEWVDIDNASPSLHTAK